MRGGNRNWLGTGFSCWMFSGVMLGLHDVQDFKTPHDDDTIRKHLVKVITELFQFLRRPVTHKSTFSTLPVTALLNSPLVPPCPVYSPGTEHTLVLSFSLRPEANTCGSEAPCGVRFDLGVTARVPSATTRVQLEMRGVRLREKEHTQYIQNVDEIAAEV